MSVDLGVQLDGFYGDAAVTLPVGRVSERGGGPAAGDRAGAAPRDREGAARRAGVGHRPRRAGAASRQHGFSVVREFVGHGIGASLHEEPQVPNYGTPGRGPRLAEGMVLAIEPMVNMGKAAVRVLNDGWTAVTRDGMLSAHFEHTVAVTRDGPLVLTAPSGAVLADAEGYWETSGSPGLAERR